MDEKRARIVEAAIVAFSRYGVRKATMGDIAEFAGVSRQTLYSNFAGKSEAFAAAADCIAGKIRSDIEEFWEENRSTEEKLDYYFQRAVLSLFEMISKTPDATDILNGYGQEGADIIRNAERNKVKMLQGLFLPYEKQLKKHGLSAQQIAELCERAGSSFLRVAEDQQELERLVSTLKSSVLALIGDK